MKYAASVAAMAGMAAAAYAPPPAYGAPPPTYEAPTTSSSSTSTSSTMSSTTPCSTSTSATATPTVGPVCPAAGVTGDMGYGCNPAHDYGNGSTCTLMNGCYILVTPSATPSSTPCSTSMTKTATPSVGPVCPAAGVTGDMGYGCNPAHAYPAGQTCTLMNGCYILVYPSTTPTPVAPATPTATPTAGPVCPAAGTTGSMGYGCNPAHSYPQGQTCELQNGCYILVTTPPAPSQPVSPVAPPAYNPPAPMSTSVTPHPPANTTTPPITPYTGAASKAFAAGAPLAAVFAIGALLL